MTQESQSEWDGDIATSPDGRLLTVALPGSVRLLRASDLSEVALNPNPAGRLSWAPYGNAYITTPDVHYRDPGRPPLEARHTVEIWALDGSLIATYQLPFIPTFATFTSDGRAVVATGRDGIVGTNSTTSVINWSGPMQSAVIDIATGKVSPLEATPVATDANRNFATDLFSVERLADTTKLATLNLPPTEPVSGPDDLQAWLVAGVDRRGRSFHPPVFSPDASLVTGFAPAQLALYSAATGARVQTLPLVSDGAGMLAFSPDGRRIAANQWGRDGATQFWCATP
jgi:WD40 repeat protein